MFCFLLRRRRPPGSPLPDSFFPYSPLFRARVVSARLREDPVRRTRALPAKRAEPTHIVSLAHDHGGRAGLPERSERRGAWGAEAPPEPTTDRSEEHTSELQSLMRISYAVFCLKKKKTRQHRTNTSTPQ